jgi:hypothetical protein
MARGYARSVAIAFRVGSMDCVVVEDGELGLPAAPADEWLLVAASHLRTAARVERTPDRFRWTA